MDGQILDGTDTESPVKGGEAADLGRATADGRGGSGWLEETVYNEQTGQYEAHRVDLREAYNRQRVALEQFTSAQANDQQAYWRRQTARTEDFQAYTIAIFKKTLDNASRTYRLITTMSTVMFMAGMGLLVFAALYATFARSDKVLSLAFGGLGVSTFVAIFVVGPVDKAQSALSNLVQAETCFMAFFEQVRMLANLPWQDTKLSAETVERASELLERRVKTTMELLQRYLEPGGASPSKPE